jgi:hypothetical protein
VSVNLDSQCQCNHHTDPYIHIVTGEGRRVVGKSAVIQNNLNPEWPPFVIDINACGGMIANHQPPTIVASAEHSPDSWA